MINSYYIRQKYLRRTEGAIGESNMERDYCTLNVFHNEKKNKRKASNDRIETTKVHISVVQNLLHRQGT